MVPGAATSRRPCPPVVFPSAVLAALLGLLAVAGPALADPGDARELARGRLTEGAALFEQGEFEQALERFRTAYAAFPSPKIFFNFGQAYRGLGRNVDAIEAFERFLAEAADAPPALRETAEGYLREVAPKVGVVVVELAEANAAVAIDGRAIGRSPMVRRVRLAPGPHQLVVEKAGHLPFTARLQVTAGQNSHLRPALVALPPPTPVAERPLYLRWWFWTALATAAAGTVTAVALSRQPDPVVCPVGRCLHEIPVP